ncbi:MAG: S8 family serine peptidase, partial [Thermoanaerobaculia bacterium]
MLRKVLLPLLLAPTLFGGVIGKQPLKVDDQRQTAIAESDGRKPRKLIEGTTVDLIVEFREPAAARVSSMARGAMTARTEEVRTRVADLQADLGSDAHIDGTFSRVLFGASVRVHRDEMKRIAALPYVKAVHIERRFEVMGETTAAATAAAAARANGGAGVKVAVLDTGIDYTHPALGGGFGEGHKVAGGWDFVNDDADPMDDNGHGTHVAGIIAADGSGLTGVA